MRVFFYKKRERRFKNCRQKRNKKKECPALTLFPRGALTVEAAFVLPIFFFAMLIFLYFMRLAQGYEQIQEGLAMTARAASQYGVLEKQRFYRYLEEDNITFPYIQGGNHGISLNGSCILPLTEEIVVKAEYTVLFPVPFFGRQGMEICQEVKSRVFSGVEHWGRKSGEEKNTLVYVTKYGSVYHRHQSCSYLNPSIQMVWGEEVFKRRNNKGGKYRPCGSCMRQAEVSERSLYITEDGDYFHSTPGCKGLNRTVYEVPLSEAAGFGCCNKCRE